MNNNRNNNRRRGRGNNRQQGGGQQLNRIDSRARGNAPQLLEKYKKLAHDAHLNGDRVQAEYFLQFADHYFRVLADSRQRQEEQRRPREERYGEGSGFDDGDDQEFGGESEMSNFDQPYRREEAREDRAPREDRPQRDDRGPREDRPQREPRREFRNRDDRPPREDRTPRVSEDMEAPASPTDDGEPAFGPAAANPFTRDNRTTRGLRPRRERSSEGERGTEADVGLDPSALPPAIAETRDQVLANEAEEAPAPKRRGRPRKAAASEEGGEPLEAVNG